MMGYSIIFSPEASEDLIEIYGYIAIKLASPLAADAFLTAVEDKIERLKEFPLSSIPLNDMFLNNKGYRKLIVDNYIVFLITNEKAKIVNIMRILYGGKDYAVEI